MKIFNVKICFDVVVRTETEDDAKVLALETVKRLDFQDKPTVKQIKELKTLQDLPPTWNSDCLPWEWEDKEEEELTLGELLNNTRN